MSLMLEEAQSAPECLRAQWQANAGTLAEFGQILREADLHGALTVARGSSDHAAAYFGYLGMKHLGLPVASVPPSLTTVANAPWRVQGQLAVAISQSGASPDLVATQKALAVGGARSLALVNTPDSPLGQVSEREIALHAGVEKSVAATKSYLATLAAGAHLVGAWADDEALLSALEALPSRLESAARQDWQPAVDALVGVDRLLVIGRGVGLAIAQEAALKFKETCAIQAEPFSAAEVRHGPMALIGPGYPVLVFAPPGPDQPGLLELAKWLESIGARVLLAADDSVAERHLPLIDAGHDDLQPLSVIQSFYVMAAKLAVARGGDPDQPRHLQKVTRTL
ncbi:SIS domain-containing protein [Salinicola salarius]|uniref:SIS domain-containing protein n=1 Tax=Salinicola salarius TaxID=430457 RepID=UPI0023E39D6A|nr:SIS domain-containing protein [Salinicola salarius]MDF3919778.1 SIS domain-containing protein [Salinicola salarius]